MKKSGSLALLSSAHHYLNRLIVVVALVVLAVNIMEAMLRMHGAPPH